MGGPSTTCDLGQEKAMIYLLLLPRVRSLEHSHSVSKFQPVPSMLDLCRNVISVNKGEAFINGNDCAQWDPNALIGDRDKQMVVFTY